MTKEEIEQSIETVAFAAYTHGKYGVSFSQWYTDSSHKDAISKSLQDFADQSVSEYKEKLIDELMKEHGHRNNSVLFIDTVEKFKSPSPPTKVVFE